MTVADIVLEARSLVDADSTSYTDATLLRRLNHAYEDTVAKIIVADGVWQFDDSNYADFPIATTNLVAGQKDYKFDTTHLEIERVEVLDNQGNYHLIYPIDRSQINVAITEYAKTDGLPSEYDKDGSSIVLYPGPGAAYVTLSAGLKVYFKRTAAIFTSGEVSTGTKSPGFASPFHMLLAYKAALPYAISYKQDRVKVLELKIQQMERDLIAFYGMREQDRRKQITMKPIRFR